MDVIGIFTAVLLTFNITTDGVVQKVGEVHYDSYEQCVNEMMLRRSRNKKNSVEYICELDGLRNDR